MKKWKYIFLSTRFKALFLGVGPVFAGILLSFPGWKNFSWVLNGSILLAVICIQTATHFFNDSLDFIKGADGPSRKGPKRPVQEGLITPSDLLWAGFVLLFLAGLAGLYLIEQGGWPIALVGLVSLALAYLYTGGPYPLAYTGLADFFVVLFFGLIPTSFVFYLNTGYWSLSSFVAGLQCGLLALSLLVANNLRDAKEDRQAGKKTLVVRWGKTFGVWECALAHFLPYAIGFYWIFEGSVLAWFFPGSLVFISFYLLHFFIKCSNWKNLYTMIFTDALDHYCRFVLALCIGLIPEFWDDLLLEIL